LHWAVARNSARAVTALLKAGADPYLRNPSELSPAHVASFNQQSDLLQIMFSCSKHTWSPPDRFKDSLMAQALSQTAFQHAICTGGDPRSLSRTLLLLRNGFETNGVYDAELVSTAIESRRTAVLEFLLDECHIDPNIGPVHTGGGASTVRWPLQIAVKSAHLPSFDLLVRHGLIERSSHGRSRAPPPAPRTRSSA
jgi:ankyrin repeat protein